MRRGRDHELSEKIHRHPGLLRLGAGAAGAHDCPAGHHPVCKPAGQRDGGPLGHRPHVWGGHCQPDRLHLQPDHLWGAFGGLYLWGPVLRQGRPPRPALHFAVPAGVQPGGHRLGDSGVPALWGAAVLPVLKRGRLLPRGDCRHPRPRQGVHRHHALWAAALCYQPVLLQHPAGRGRDLLPHGGQPYRHLCQFGWQLPADLRQLWLSQNGGGRRGPGHGYRPVGGDGLPAAAHLPPPQAVPLPPGAVPGLPRAPVPGQADCHHRHAAAAQRDAVVHWHGGGEHVLLLPGAGGRGRHQHQLHGVEPVRHCHGGHGQRHWHPLRPAAGGQRHPRCQGHRAQAAVFQRVRQRGDWRHHCGGVALYPLHLQHRALGAPDGHPPADGLRLIFAPVRLHSGDLLHHPLGGQDLCHLPV